MKKLFLLLLICSFVSLSAIAQTRAISGVVTSSVDGEPLVGVTVVVKGSPAIGTATDIDGKFELSVPEDATALIVSAVGLVTQEVELGTTTTFQIVLESSDTGLDEVIVVGYGTQIKSKVTGNISKVRGDEIENTPVPSIQQAMQGKAAGVFIESTNGKTSGVTRMRIRGSSSITAENEPLFIVDGVPLSNEPLNQSGADINPLTSINFNDIESIEILKDASSAAMYGSRGANGVVLITTKRGKAGKTKLNVNFQYGFSQATRFRDFMNAEQYISHFREAAANGDAYDDFYY